MTIMRYSSETRPAKRITGLGLLALLLILTAGPALWVGTAQAKGCFPDVYYEMMFQPKAQEAAGGDTRLVGMSDYLAAKGEDPHSEGTGSGCMCGVNNGRWDQMLFNASMADDQRAPVAFKILGIRADFQTKEGQAQGKPIVISPARLDKCFGASVKGEGRRAYNHPAGKVAGADVLEPGENLVGCLCLGQELAGASGKVTVAVTYRRSVFARGLAMSPAKQGLAGGAALKGLARGEAVYYIINLPQGASDVSVSVAAASGLAVYTSTTGFQEMMEGWRAGPLKAKSLKPGAEVWVMLRAKSANASGMLKVAYIGQTPATAKGRLIELPGDGVRGFIAYILGMGGGGKKKDNPLAPKPVETGGCCSGEG